MVPQDWKAEAQVERIGTWIGVFLLVTSGLILPLAAFAAGPVQPSNTVPARIDFKNEHAVVDGVPSPVVVSQVYFVVPHSFVHGKMHDSWCGQVIPECAQVKGVDFTPGFSQTLGPAGGCYLKVGLGMGETVITPQSVSAVSSVTASVPKLWWDFFQRRSKLEIYVEILEVIKRSPMTPFEIAFYARLNHKRTKEYVEFLVRSGYLQPLAEEGRMVYALTKEGVGFVERAKALFVGTRLIEVANYNYQRDF